MDKYSMEYGNFIKEHRQKMGLTQEEVSKKLGISQVAYGRYELGTRTPSFELIFKIADVLGFEPGDFFNKYKG